MVGSVIGKGLSVVAGIVIARFLGKEIYGEYGMIRNTLMQIAIFSTLGLGYTGTRYVAKYVENGRENVIPYIRIIYRITLLVSTLLALLVFVFAAPVAAYLEAPDTAPAFRLTAAIIIINAVNTAQVGILSGFKAFKDIARINGWSGVVTLALSAVLTYWQGLYGALVALLISLLFNALLNGLSIRKYTGSLPSASAGTAAGYGEIIRFSLPIALQESAYSVIGWTTSLILIKFSDYGQMGLSSVACQWYNIVLFIPGVLKNVMLSHFSSESDHRVLRNRMMAVNFLSTLVCFAGVAVFSHLIASFYGESFRDELPLLLIISCLGSVFNSVGSVILYDYISSGKTWTSFMLSTIRDCATLGLMYFAISSGRFGIPASRLLSIITMSVAFAFAALLLAYEYCFKKRNDV